MSTAIVSTAAMFGSANSVRSVNAARSVGSSHLRMTRRGRMLITLLIAGPLVVGAFAMVTNGGSATATNHASVAPLQYVTVQPGETLWQLAAQISPASDPRDVVAEVAQLNQLASGDIQAGQRLAIPAQYGH